jgi:hypothetical protein
VRRRRTTTIATTAAIVTASPNSPMNAVLSTPSAAIAPSTPRIGPMQHAAHASAAKPVI